MVICGLGTGHHVDMHRFLWDRRAPGRGPGPLWGADPGNEQLVADELGTLQKGFLRPRAAQLLALASSEGSATLLSSLNLLPNEKEEIRDNCRTDRAAV